jgi:hypothetical protein
MNTDHTLEEVGQQFSVTRERIRQIEAKALRKLKHPSRSRKLCSFLDNWLNRSRRGLPRASMMDRKRRAKPAVLIFGPPDCYNCRNRRGSLAAFCDPAQGARPMINGVPNG